MKDKINIAELLKGCPKGTELYSPLCGRCVFDQLNMGTIICKKQNMQEITFTSEGYYMLPVFNDCECMLFPSKDQRDWRKFQRPFKDGDVVALGSNDGAQLFIFKEYIHHDYAKCYMMLDRDESIDFGIKDYHVARLATEEEKQKLFDAIKVNGYKWNTETKTLKKLVEPKFKVGGCNIRLISTCMGELKKTRYNQRIWLNKDDSPSTGSFVAFDGDTTHYGNIARNMFVSISDCYQSARLHLTEDDTIEDFISKLKKLRNGLSDFIDHLEKNKQ